MDQLKTIIIQRLKTLEDFYWEVSGTEDCEKMDQLWDEYPLASQLSGMRRDVSRMFFLDDPQYRDEVNELDRKTYLAFGQKYVDFSKAWEKEYGA